MKITPEIIDKHGIKPEEYKKIISLIEEPVLRNKLAEMLSDIEIDNQFIQKMIQKQSDYLRDILKITNK